MMRSRSPSGFPLLWEAGLAVRRAACGGRRHLRPPACSSAAPDGCADGRGWTPAARSPVPVRPARTRADGFFLRWAPPWRWLYVALSLLDGPVYALIGGLALEWPRFRSRGFGSSRVGPPDRSAELRFSTSDLRTLCLLSYFSRESLKPTAPLLSPPLAHTHLLARTCAVHPATPLSPATTALSPHSICKFATC